MKGTGALSHRHPLRLISLLNKTDLSRISSRKELLKSPEMKISIDHWDKELPDVLLNVSSGKQKVAYLTVLTRNINTSHAVLDTRGILSSKLQFFFSIVPPKIRFQDQPQV